MYPVTRRLKTNPDSDNNLIHALSKNNFKYNTICDFHKLGFIYGLQLVISKTFHEERKYIFEKG